MSERWLRPEVAAERLDISSARLSRLVREGKIPSPSYHLGPRSPRYDIELLDSAMSEARASRDPDHMIEVYLAKKKAERAHRTSRSG